MSEEARKREWTTELMRAAIEGHDWAKKAIAYIVELEARPTLTPELVERITATLDLWLDHGTHVSPATITSLLRDILNCKEN